MAVGAMDRDAIAAPVLGHAAHAVGDREELRDRARTIAEIHLADAGADPVLVAVPGEREVDHGMADLRSRWRAATGPGTHGGSASQSASRGWRGERVRG